MKKNFLFIFLIFLVNSIFSYSSTNNSTDEELQKVFDKNKEIIVVYRASIKDVKIRSASAFSTVATN